MRCWCMSSYSFRFLMVLVVESWAAGPMRGSLGLVRFLTGAMVGGGGDRILAHFWDFQTGFVFFEKFCHLYLLGRHSCSERL